MIQLVSKETVMAYFGEYSSTCVEEMRFEQYSTNLEV
jgi:hypothetical protein